MKEKGVSDVEEGSVYVDELRSQNSERSSKMRKFNETMTTSLDNCEYTAAENNEQNSEKL